MSRVLLLSALAALLSACGGSLAARHGLDALPDAKQLVEIADVLTARGDSVRAQQYLLRAQQLHAPESVVLPRLLRLYVADGQYRLAIEHAEHSLHRHPRDAELREFVATLYAAIGQVDHALAQYEAVIARTPDNADVHYAIASLLRRSGSELARASDHYRAYLALAPEGEHAEEARAGLLAELP